jgi:pimeloyl-ACP methyl ester carboxylesterase
MTDTTTPPQPPTAERHAVLTRDDGAAIAYHKTAGRKTANPGVSDNPPGVVFMAGFRSDMTGDKALALERMCRENGRDFVRFDYFGHGESSGVFTDGTIGRWRDDAVAVLDQLTDGPQVLVGSSMGGWIMLLAALARPRRVAGLVGIAAAPDFTEELIWRRITPEIRETLERDGVYHEPTEYDDTPSPITLKLIEDGRQHLLLERPIPIHCPVWLFHGMRDDAVPWTTAPRISDALLTEHVRIFLVKDGDHRLSRDGDLARLCTAVDGLCRQVAR